MLDIAQKMGGRALMSTSILATLRKAVSALPRYRIRRRGCLGPMTTMLTLVAMSDPGSRSYSRGISAVFQALEASGDLLGLVPEHLPSRSAFSQARRRTGSEIFCSWFQNIRDTCTQGRKDRTGFFHGLRRVSIDGTRICLPCHPSLSEHFGHHGAPPARSKVPMGGLVLLWDSSANQPIDWEIQGAAMNERSASMNLVARLGPNDVLLADRGYPSFEFFERLFKQNTQFIVRMNTTTVSVPVEVREFLESGADDSIITCAPIHAKRRRFGGNSPMRLRLVRDREHGDRVIATNLYDATVTREDILAAYCTRWNVETAIRELKDWRGLEDLRSQWPDGIHQEIAAIMTFLYLVGEMEAEMRLRMRQRVEEGKASKEELKPENMPTFNRCLMGHISVTMLIRSATGRDLKKWWTLSVDQLWRERNAKRPGRSYPRSTKKPHAKFRKTGPFGSRS